MFQIGEEEKEEEEEVIFLTRLGAKKMTLPIVQSFEGEDNGDRVGLVQ